MAWVESERRRKGIMELVREVFLNIQIIGLATLLVIIAGVVAGVSLCELSFYFRNKVQEKSLYRKIRTCSDQTFERFIGLLRKDREKYRTRGGGRDG